MNTQPLQLEDVFSRAVELPNEERQAFLARLCGDDPQLLAEAVKLLQSHEKNEQEGFILDRPLDDQDEASEVATIAESEGDSIGRYRLLEKIGEGGMGVVYMAEQTEGVRRRVALKIIKLGMDTRQVIARFEAERQAMAMFDHPNITRVFDAGCTQTGRPYFVMELVKGTSITEFAKSVELSLPDRLQLFSSVCNAVQHAHQKGIIHRDLKPSNILVTRFDGVPIPKVIDFGIAKAINFRLTEKTVFTRYSAVVGTPQYMSPEQADMSEADVDTRSDIYSLGVVLYELITGSPPFPNGKLEQLNPLEILETIRDANFETPSTRLAKLQPDSVHSRPKHQSKRLHGELDWIVMKALNRDRKKRYASANELASDINRYLTGDPIEAAPPKTFYRFQAIARKHKRTFATASTIAATLLVATIACSIFALKLHRANGQLATANHKLQANVEQLKEAKDRLRKAADSKLYESAVSMAIAKFDLAYLPTIYDYSDELFPLYESDWNGQLALTEEAVNDNSNSELGPVDNEIYLCYDYQQTLLIDLRYQAIVAGPLAVVEAAVSRENDFENRLFSEVIDSDEFPSLFSNESEVFYSNEEHEHSAECELLQSKIEKSFAAYRPIFYEILVGEYRSAFGQHDARVASSLNMLAASLIEVERYDEAITRLEDSLTLTSKSRSAPLGADSRSDRQAALQLMHLARKLKASKQPARRRSENTVSPSEDATA